MGHAEGVVGAMFDDGSAVISRKTDLVEAGRDRAFSVHDFYEVDRCAAEIARRGASRVALQLPDELLDDSLAVCAALDAALEAAGHSALVFVLGDTSYGACCVDSVAANHLGADLVVHYGRACQTPTAASVLYVFGKAAVDAHRLAETLRDFAAARGESRLILTYDAQYYYAAGQLVARLRAALAAAGRGTPQITGARPSALPLDAQQEPLDAAPDGDSFTLGGLRVDLPSRELQASVVVHLGGRSRAYEAALMRCAACGATIALLEPSGSSAPAPQDGALRLISQRFGVIEKAKDAEVVGLIVGVLSAERSSDALQLLAARCEARGKRTYTFAMGRPKPEKLANFQECDVFVHVACELQALALKHSDFFRPIVTPLEMEIALGERDWDGDYSNALRDLQCLTEGYGEIAEERGAKEETALATLQGSEIAVFQSAAADFLAQREYQGLEQPTERTEVRPAREGTFGVASRYTDHSARHKAEQVAAEAIRDAEREAAAALPPAEAATAASPPRGPEDAGAGAGGEGAARAFAGTPGLFDDITSSEDEA